MTIRFLSLALLLLLKLSAQNTPLSFDPFEAIPAAKDQPATAPHVQRTEHSTLTLLSELKAFKPGEAFQVALKFEHDPTWHSYYKNPGSVGLIPEATWTLPEGWEASELEFPVPHTGTAFGETFYGYSGTNYFFVTLTPPAGVSPGESLTLKMDAAWQVCDPSSCVMETAAGLSLTLQAAAEAEPSPAAEELHEARLALPWETDQWQINMKQAGSRIIFELTPQQDGLAKLEDLYFFAATESVIDSSAPQEFEATEQGYRLTVQKVEDAAEMSAPYGILSTSSSFDAEGQRHGLLVSEVNQVQASTDELYEDVSAGELALILGGMILGGLILNLMPCVFPVIGLKIMGFVNQAGEDKKKIVAHGLIFTAGVLASFWALSGLLLSLREQALKGGGEEVGWGYQLQNPWMVWGLLLVMFILGLNMFGLFEIGARATSVGGKLQAKQGMAGTFFSGILATVVATPCSAPFLGAAIGAAFALPPVKFMLAFTAMAIGLSLPYLILSIFPSLVKKLPRPGAWMESFKQGMAFLLFGTSAFLVWVYLAQVESFHGLSVLIGLTAIAAAAWVYGRWTAMSRSRGQRIGGTVVALVLISAGLYASRPVTEVKVPWEAWSATAVEEALKEGRPVYVDFTAKWCLTCQANKKVAYSSEVVRAFGERNVLMLQADKTQANPKIEAALKALNRSAIPVNVLYVPGREDPIITPEVLSSSYLLELLEKEIPQEK